MLDSSIFLLSRPCGHLHVTLTATAKSMKSLKVVVQVQLVRKGFITDFAHVRDVVVFFFHFVLLFQMELDDTLMTVPLAAMLTVVQY